MKTGHFACALLLVLGTGAIATLAQDAAQPQTDTLAAAARRAREEKKAQPSAAKVYTNDDLPTNATISYVGQPPAAAKTDNKANAATPAAPGAQSKDAKAAASAAAKSQLDADKAALASAKDQLKSAQTDLDIMQRKFALDQQSYLSNPNHSSDTGTAASLQSEQDSMSAKKDEVDAAKKVVDDLNAKIAAESNSSSSGGADNSAPTPSDNSSSTSGTSSTTATPGTAPVTAGTSVTVK